MPRGIRVIESGGSHLDRELAAFRNCITGVDHEIQKGRLELGRVDSGVPKASCGDAFNRDRLPYSPTDPRQDFLHDMTEIDNFRLQWPAPGKGQKLLVNLAARSAATLIMSIRSCALSS